VSTGWYLMSKDFTAFSGKALGLPPEDEGPYFWLPPGESEPYKWIAEPLVAMLAQTSWKERSPIWEQIEGQLFSHRGRPSEEKAPQVSLRIFPVCDIYGGLSWPLPSEENILYRKVVDACACFLMRKAIFPPWVFRDEEGHNRMAPSMIFTAFLDAARQLDLSHIPAFVVGPNPKGIPIVDAIHPDYLIGLFTRGSIHPDFWNLDWPHATHYDDEQEGLQPNHSHSKHPRRPRPKPFPLVQEDQAIIPILEALLRRLMSLEDFSPEACVAAGKLLQGLHNLPAPTPGLHIWLFAHIQRPGGNQLCLDIELSEKNFMLTHREIHPVFEAMQMETAHLAFRAEADGERVGEPPSYVLAWVKALGDMALLAEECTCWDIAELENESFWEEPKGHGAWKDLPPFNGVTVQPLPYQLGDIGMLPPSCALRQR